MMKDNINKEDGFIIEFWANIFSFLSKISIFSFVRKKKNDNTHVFVERWVLGNLLLAITTTLIGYYLDYYNKVVLIYYNSLCNIKGI